MPEIGKIAALAGSLLIVIGAILVTYYASKYLLNKSGFSSGRYLKIIDRIMIGRDKYLLLVSLGEQTYFIGVSDKNVVLLEKMAEELPREQLEHPDFSFQKILSGLKKKEGLDKR